LRHLRCAPLGS